MKRIIAFGLKHSDNSIDWYPVKLTGTYKGYKDPIKRREYMKALMRRKRAGAVRPAADQPASL